MLRRIEASCIPSARGGPVVAWRNVVQIKLDFDVSPIYQTYLTPTYPLSIFGAHGDTRAILATYYINFCLPKGKVVGTSRDGAAISPWISAKDFSRLGYFRCREWRFGDSLRADPAVIPWITTSLIDGWYPYAHVDEYYIPGTSPYKKRGFRHPALVVGWSGRSKIFNIITYLSNGSYGETAVHCNDLALAIYSSGGWDKSGGADGLSLYCVKPEAVKNPFNIYTSMAHISNYISSRENCEIDGIEKSPAAENTNAQYQAIHKGNDLLYGLDAFNAFGSYILRVMDANLPIDLRDTRALWEHKKIIFLNLLFWAEYAGNIESSIRSNYDVVVKWAHVLHLLSFDYNLSYHKNTTALRQHIGKLTAIVEIERGILERILRLLHVSVQLRRNDGGGRSR